MTTTATDHALCSCGHGFTFDFTTKTVYCKRCSTADWLTQKAREVDAHGHFIDPGTDKAREWAAMLRSALFYVELAKE